MTKNTTCVITVVMEFKFKKGDILRTNVQIVNNATFYEVVEVNSPMVGCYMLKGLKKRNIFYKNKELVENLYIKLENSSQKGIHILYGK